MIQQRNNKFIRTHHNANTSDILYLKHYYTEHGHFPLFQQVLIETRTDCNNKCSFCPHAFKKKPLGIMTRACYNAIIKQLCEIGYNGRVALMLSNEPLLDDRLEEMITYAKTHSQRFFLDITTNGRLLTLEKLDKLFMLGLDNVTVNDYRNDREKYPNKISSYLKPIFDAYRNNPKLSISFRRMDETLPNYAGNIPQKFDKKDYGFCNYPFRKLVIAYNGNILLCCDDFIYDTCFGNVMRDSLVDCWNHQDINKIRHALLEGKRTNICNRCNDFQNYNVF